MIMLLESAARPLPLAMAFVIFSGLGSPGSAQDDRASEASRLNPLASLRPSDLNGFRSMPLFTPSRQPPPVVRLTPNSLPVIAPIVRREPPKLRLTGIVQGSTTPMAILQRSDAGANTTVRIGDDVDGWLVTSIDPLGIRLRNGAHEHEYKLFGGDSSPVDGPEAAATAKPARRINHPPVDLGANLRAKPQAQP
ncbi:MAG: hypothetical protein AVDCRST_MAG90-634 [uncultured Microvirga sp.]|uniref:Type II secretion system protein GspC N-terminal domain-containing protein n=1 Tax=uncultured Microvirga sp. TaxID=412392 RepID=A0A6J4KTL5_9HYPH|nr:MAG: hypothetical protein AVDCRST_MAG90-634 [uncultured Microvirga sp.]